MALSQRAEQEPVRLPISEFEVADNVAARVDPTGDRPNRARITEALEGALVPQKPIPFAVTHLAHADHVARVVDGIGMRQGGTGDIQGRKDAGDPVEPVARRFESTILKVSM